MCLQDNLKTGKKQGARRWSGNVFQSLGAAALKAAAAEEEVTVRSVNKFADPEWRLREGRFLKWGSHET